MIKKEFKVPLHVRKLEALLRRLPMNHPMHREIQDEYARHMAGFKGEQSLEYYLSFLPMDNYFIFHHLRLPCNGHYFQIDTLILSSRYYLLVEVKNISGTLVFDPECGQLIWSQNGSERALQEPLDQVKHQRFQFEHWLKTNKCPSLPIETLVVVANPSSIVKFQSGDRHYRSKIIRSINLIERIQKFDQLHKTDRTSAKEIRRLTNLLKKQHTPNNQDVLKRYNLLPTDILPGVQCPHCFHLPMKRMYAKWKCPKCENTSRDAHIQAIEDHALLIDIKVANNQLREYLHLPSASITNKLAKNLVLPSSGTNKGRVYHLPFEK